MNTTVEKDKIPILDVGRFVGAVIVIFVHYETIFGDPIVYGTLGTTFLSWFFVLSGFILSYNYPEIVGRAGYRRFYSHRVIRIFPAYLLAVLVSAAFVSIGYLNLGDQFWEEVHRPLQLRFDLPEDLGPQFWIRATAAHITFTQSLSEIQSLNLVFNGPLWSLVLEMYFYVTFPFWLIALRRVDTLPRILLLMLALYLLQFGLIQSWLPPGENLGLAELNIPVYTNPIVRGSEFILGMLLYRIHLLRPPEIFGRFHPLWLLPAVALYLGTVYLAQNYLPYQYGSFYLSVPAVTLIVYVMSRLDWEPDDRQHRFCFFLGGVSYVLYCFHWPLMEILQFFDFLPHSLPVLLHSALLAFILLVFCTLIYLYAEVPLRQQLRSLFKTF